MMTLDLFTAPLTDRARLAIIADTPDPRDPLPGEQWPDEVAYVDPVTPHGGHWQPLPPAPPAPDGGRLAALAHAARLAGQTQQTSAVAA